VIVAGGLAGLMLSGMVIFSDVVIVAGFIVADFGLGLGYMVFPWIMLVRADFGSS